ncbi:hypothetical protein QRD89_10705 [Halobacillus sp. ACCC02827]|uniref:hypothetical protein n=1 Tax=Bacillaceae TaxID=186817 RepID=UPI0004130076|nr:MULTISPECIES: hypothetical protein [Bacillaceae]QHT46971.1 hypothetical protein M662_10875 [Bacillus sp. SB49]WJE14197.1 hypothetical protein QRD89_10705 [Halobacillus sp. ACCC02827]
MDILKHMLEEGYGSARFSSVSGKEFHVDLHDLISSKELFDKMEIIPRAIEYFPFERVPYIALNDGEQSYKIKLIKL